tara:strand:- start:424 stop:663 length:240 start_codon:yes stop_codon:yes gene_type:complete
LIEINLGCEISPLRFVVVRAKTADDTIYVLAASVAHPAFVITLFKVYGELALVVLTVGALKKKLIVGPVAGAQHISQYL